MTKRSGARARASRVSLAAAAGALIVAACTRRPLETAPSRPPVASAPATSSAPAAPAATARATPRVLASEPTAPTAPTAIGSYATFERPNGALLRPGTLKYRLSLVRTGQPARPLGERTVTVAATSTAGAPTWLLLETRSGSAVPTVDSLVLTRSDLAPVRWWASIGSARLSASSSRDTIYGASISYQGRSSFAVPLPPGALLTAGMVERLLEMLPLRVGYRAGASLLLVELGSPRAVPAELAVDREERIDVLGRAEECWVATLRAGALEERLWVTKGGARVVRTEQAVAGGTLIAELAR